PQASVGGEPERASSFRPDGALDPGARRGGAAAERSPTSSSERPDGQHAAGFRERGIRAGARASGPGFRSPVSAATRTTNALLCRIRPAAIALLLGGLCWGAEPRQDPLPTPIAP